jgi:hypothetical protein
MDAHSISRHVAHRDNARYLQEQAQRAPIASPCPTKLLSKVRVHLRDRQLNAAACRHGYRPSGFQWSRWSQFDRGPAYQRSLSREKAMKLPHLEES